MPELHLTFAETGPIPDPQCALKDALLLAMQSGQTDAQQIVANAGTFLAFLQGGGDTAPAAAAPAAPEAGATEQPQQAQQQPAAAAPPAPASGTETASA